ncbi:MAG: hypothetical protein KGZ75_14525 [Syntrophomonadaceae bacterium]|nr:hypothetical protein [Syntrophomonadaceae bacterium]
MENLEKLSRLSEKQVRELQEQRLQSFLGGEVASRHPAYREAWQAVPRSLADLSILPFTTKDELLPTPGNPTGYLRYVLESPASAEAGGGFLSILLAKKRSNSTPEKYATSQIFFSAGRTGRITPYVYSVYDVDQLREAGLHLLNVLGLTQDDTMVNAMPYLPNLCFWQIYYATVSMGATALQTGGGRILGAEKIIAALESMEASTLFSTPGYAEYLLQSAIQHQIKLPHLQNIIVGYTPAPLPVVSRLEMLAGMAGSLSAKVKRIYFLNEAKVAWPECSPGSGYHFYPDHSLLEALELASDERKRSELVLTNLDVKGSCVVRFRTGDLIDGITFDTCPNCNRRLPRLVGEIERLQEFKTFRFNGKEKSLNLNSLHGLLAAEPEVLLWQAVVSPVQGLGLDVSLRNKNDAPKVLPRLQEMLATELGVVPQVTVVSYRDLVERLGLEKFPVEKRIIEWKHGDGSPASKSYA